MPKPDRQVQMGKASIARKNDRYTVRVGRFTLENVTREEVAELSAALTAIVELEHQEMIEEKRARGEPIYVEYRGEEVARKE
jgi:maleate cis-trans isomerase